LLAKNYLLPNLIKIAIAKNISKIPITIKAIFMILVIVEVLEFETLETLLTVEDVFDVEFVLFSLVDVLEVEDAVFWEVEFVEESVSAVEF